MAVLARLAAVSALASSLLIAPIAHAAQQPVDRSHSITISSRGNGRSTERFTAPIRLKSASWDVKGAAFAVLYFQRLGKRRPQPDGVSIWMHADGRSLQTTLGVAGGVLPAGRYRVSVFSQGRSSIHISTADPPHATLRLPDPATGRIVVQTVQATQEASPPFMDSLTHLSIPARRSPLVVAGAVTSWDRVAAISYDFDLCVVPHGSSCSDGDPTYGTGQSATMSTGSASAELYETGAKDVADSDVVAEWRGTTRASVTTFVLFGSRTR